MDKEYLFFPRFLDDTDTIRDDVGRDSLHISWKPRMFGDIDEKSITLIAR